MRINDKGLRKAERREKARRKAKNGMRVSNKSIFILEEQKVKKKKEADEK